MKDALPGAIEPASGLALSARRRQASARRVQPRHRRRAHRAHHRAAGDRARALRSASGSACPPDISAGASTRCCRSSPISCSPSRSSCCSICSSRRAFSRRRSPIRWPAIFFLFPIVLLLVLFWSGYQREPGAARGAARADRARRRLAVRDLRVRRRSARRDPRQPEHAQHFRRGRAGLRPRHLPHRAQPDARHQDARICARGADARRKRRGTSCCGKSCPTRAGR